MAIPAIQPPLQFRRQSPAGLVAVLRGLIEKVRSAKTTVAAE